MGASKMNPFIHIIFSFLLIVLQEDTSILEKEMKEIYAKNPYPIIIRTSSQCSILKNAPIIDSEKAAKKLTLIKIPLFSIFSILVDYFKTM